MYSRTIQILQKNIHKRAVESSAWIVNKYYKYNICSGGNTEEASLEMANGRSPKNEDTLQIRQKRLHKKAVESGQREVPKCSTNIVYPGAKAFGKVNLRTRETREPEKTKTR